MGLAKLAKLTDPPGASDTQPATSSRARLEFQEAKKRKNGRSSSVASRSSARIGSTASTTRCLTIVCTSARRRRARSKSRTSPGGSTDSRACSLVRRGRSRSGRAQGGRRRAPFAGLPRPSRTRAPPPSGRGAARSALRFGRLRLDVEALAGKSAARKPACERGSGVVLVFKVSPQLLQVQLWIWPQIWIEGQAQDKDDEPCA